MKTFSFALILLFSYLPFASAETLRMDGSYGQVSQTDPQLLSWGLIKDSSSFLCVPTVITNGLTKLRKNFNKTSAFPSEVYEVADFVTRLAPLTGINIKEFSQQGIRVDKAEVLLKYKLKKEGFNARTLVYNVDPLRTLKPSEDHPSYIDLADLKKATTPGNIRILVISGWNLNSVEEINAQNFWQRYFGHVVLVVGYDEDNPLRFLVSDPYWPDQPYMMTLEPVGSPYFTGGTAYVIHIEGRSHRDLITLSSVISVSVE